MSEAGGTNNPARSETGNPVGNQNGTAKRCVICGADCAGRPRVKDPSGRYYCRECHEKKADELHGRISHSVAPPPVIQDDVSDFASLASEAALAPVAAAGTIMCPSCHAPLVGGSVFCVGCGHDLRTGRAVQVKVTRAPASSKAQSTSGNAPSSMLNLSKSVAFLIAYIIVISDAIDLSTLQASWRPIHGWGPVILRAFAAGAIWTLIWGYLGPGWLYFRVRWAGGETDLEAARSLYFATMVPYAAVASVTAVLLLTGYASPTEAAQQEGSGLQFVLWLVGLACLFGSCVWNFLVARSALGVRAVAGALLLIVLPFAWYVIQIVGTIALIASLAVASPKTFAKLDGTAAFTTSFSTRSATPAVPIHFKYPSNWTSAEHPEDAETHASVHVNGPDGSSLTLAVVPLDADHDEILQSLRESYSALGVTLVPTRELSMMANWIGEGREYVVRSADGEMRLRLFVALHRTQKIIIEALVPEPDNGGGGPAIDRVLLTIRLVPG